MTTFNTGNPIGSTDARDRSDNSENLDLAVNSLSLTFVDRFGVTRDTLEGVYQKSAYYRAGTFDTGYTLTNNRQTLAYGNIEYSWSGAFPKVVAAASTPETTGGIGSGAWVDRTDFTLRNELSNYKQYTFSSVPKMQIGETTGGFVVSLKIGDICHTGSTKWRIGSNASGVSVVGGLYAEPLTAICIDDFSLDSAEDNSADIQSMLACANSFGIARVYSNGGKLYKLQNTVTIPDATELDFGWSVVIDDVKGFIPLSANRAKQTIVMYGTSGSMLKRVNWMVAPTRDSNANANIPDILVWVGGQYLGSGVTSNGAVSDIVFQQTRVGMMPIGVLGELRGFKFKNIDIYGDASYGINFEYGLAPSDPTGDATMSNGRHPYNCVVENFNGWNLLNCSGFLRVASCYNIKFKNCQGFNVKNFIYCYGGDRNISRFDENVRFVNCKSKIDESALSSINYAVSILIPNKDGSTGDALPSWTNYDASFVFDSCEFWNNTTLDSACVRYFGSQGAVIFNCCKFKRSYYGVRGGPSANPSYRSRNSLVFNDCIFDQNYQDINLNGLDGVRINGGKLRRQIVTSTLPQISMGATDPVNYSSIVGLLVAEQTRQNFAVDIVSGVGNNLEKNRFELFSTANTAIQSSVLLSGYGNSTNGTLISTAITSKRIKGEPTTGFKNSAGQSGASFDYEIADRLLVNSTVSLTNCTNGKDGDELLFRGGTAGASLTITHSAGGTGQFLNKSGVSDTATGNLFAKKYVYRNGSWYEI